MTTTPSTPSTPTTPAATGHKEEREGREFVVFTRTFRAPIDDVWAAVTESDRLGRWIGTWEGDPAEGQVRFQMRFEGDEASSEKFQIDVCEPPHRLAITTEMPYDGVNPQTWQLRVELAERDGVTTLTFAQDVPEPEMAHSVGPGWDYYLDRMVVAEAGGDPGTLDFDDYYPALADHYKAEFA
jgi:uncharacterized protein YndB with AHSA1/START domain